MRLAGALVATAVLASALATSCGPKPDPDPTVGVTERVPRWTGWMPSTLGQPAAATVVGESVVVVGAAGGVAVLDRGTGAPRWRHPPPDPETSRYVRVADGAVVLRDGDVVEVRDLRTGELRREVRQVRAVAVTWTTLYVALGGQCPRRPHACGLFAIDIVTGRQRWWYDAPVSHLTVAPGDPITKSSSPPTGHSWRTLRAPTSPVVLLRRTGDPLDDLVALHAATGQVMSTHPIPAPSDVDAVTLGSGQTYLEWVHSGQCQVTVTGHRLWDGSQVWSATFGAWSWEAPQPRCRWSPELVGGGLLVATRTGRARLVDVDTGQVRWTGPPTARQVTAADGVVILRGDSGTGLLIAFDPATEALRWSGRVPKGAAGVWKRLDRPMAGGGHLAYRTEYVTGNDTEYLLWLRDLATGQLHWVARDAGTPIGIGTGWLMTTGPPTSAVPSRTTQPPVGPAGPVLSPTTAPMSYPIHLYHP